MFRKHQIFKGSLEEKTGLLSSQRQIQYKLKEEKRHISFEIETIEIRYKRSDKLSISSCQMKRTCCPARGVSAKHRSLGSAGDSRVTQMSFQHAGSESRSCIPVASLSEPQHLVLSFRL